MNEIIQTILQWPMIVQGALGSGLFWLILYLGGITTSFFSKRFSRYSSRRRKMNLLLEAAKCRLSMGEVQTRAAFIALLIYRATRELTMGFLWLTLGLMFQTIVPVFGVVGYVGALYYFFNAWQVCKPVEKEVDAEKRVREIEDEIKELENTEKNEANR